MAIPTITIDELLHIIGSQQVELFLKDREIARLQAQIATLTT